MSSDPYYMDEVGATMMYENYESPESVESLKKTARREINDLFEKHFDDSEGGFTSPEAVEAHRLRADLTEPPLLDPTEEIQATKGELIDLLDQYEAVLKERDALRIQYWDVAKERNRLHIALAKIAKGDHDNVDIARKALGWL